MSNILVLGGGIESYEGIKHIKELGHKIILCDINRNASSVKLSDFFIEASIYHEDQVLEGVKKFVRNGGKIDGVLAVATDAVRSVAEVASYLTLPGISRKTAFIATEKIEMKKRFREFGLNIPEFYEIVSLKDLKEIIKSFPNKQFVIKPVDSRGARGVLRLNSLSDLEFAFEFSKKYSKSKKLILEEWIDGPQLSVESVIWKNEHFLCGIADRNYSREKETYPFVVEDGGETPSSLSEKYWNALDKTMYEAALSIGLEKGTIKGDIIIHKDKVYIIEAAARLSGGYFSTITIPEVYGNDIVKAATEICLNQKPDFESFSRYNKKYQANRFLFLQQGTIKNVNIDLTKIKNDPLVKKVVFQAKEGDNVNMLTDHTKRQGMVLCVGDEKKSVIAKCEEIINYFEKSIIIK